MARTKGSKNRNYPSLTLEQALEIARTIQDGASGMPVSKLILAELVDKSPSSSVFRELLLASRAYGLTTGGVNADNFGLTPLGNEITGADEVVQSVAKRKAVLNIEPFRTFLTSYNGKKVPSNAAFREFLVQNASVPQDRAEDCVEHIQADAQYASLLRELKGSKYIDLKGTVPAAAAEANGEGVEEEPEPEPEIPDAGQPQLADEQKPPAPAKPKKVFIAHGKNRAPLEELKQMLNKFKVPYAVSVDEPHRGRPISAKVAGLMSNECSSGIFIFTADEKFLVENDDGDPEEVWRPSENVVYELGAASVLYDRRIVIFKQKGVVFPSDFSDLGYIDFESGKLAEKTGDLFSELVALDILEVRAKG